MSKANIPRRLTYLGGVLLEVQTTRSCLGGSDRRPAGTSFYTSKVIDPSGILPGEVVLLSLALVQQLNCAGVTKWCDDVNDAVNTSDNIFHPAWRAPLALRQGSINDTIQNLKMTGSDYEQLGNAMLKYGIVQHEAPSTADICKYAAALMTIDCALASTLHAPPLLAPPLLAPLLAPPLLVPLLCSVFPR